MSKMTTSNSPLTPPWKPGFVPFVTTLEPEERLRVALKRAEVTRKEYLFACEQLYEAGLDVQRLH